jgi:hypothetical protein
METDSLYCKACKDAKNSVHNRGSESLSGKVQSDTKNESPKQESLIPKHSKKYELTDDFFDEFSNDDSDDSEEYDSEDNSGVVPTLLWWFYACEEISLSSMEECDLISSSCKKFSCKEFANDEDGLDHGNGDFEDQSSNGEDENGDDTTSTVNHQLSTKAALWDFPSDSDYLSWNRDENGESEAAITTTIEMRGIMTKAMIMAMKTMDL